ncbi:hypothetical protein AGDE_00664 [Angomonas deanei]|uniref:Plus-3 domain/Zinc finger, C3HC4 type (RING finger) containing protein, putative n=1 Tax=Angomonas deanei TaxID=59799 RepID=S9WS96_9TRYP|nr:hypothetical protein AGDE_12075 [Angomonas deanei]EPY42321.1 hypothetical protein AGDE_01602 [Angomonas deanei]EPY43258.1 hypothetical protein AGDE_00664 [Angomonas deanei]CAD2220603.1 Plus-3 domain/Zinc finger, C3HC4 type (RING finger) containing protein, putative [Angomonas deanei]|eukprot:EPY24981.1 hypothetical protein AGDE_12075 [Angomonas deanei]
MSHASEPPSLELLKELQLFRTTVVQFLGWKNFEQVIKGCYVRVLLEMRNDDTRDKYYIACIKSAKKGTPYSGFSADGAKTDWHIVVELPTCFKSTQAGNTVQLNSISNAPFQQSEYDNWVKQAPESNKSHPFPSVSQLQFRLGMLIEQRKQSLAFEPRKRRAGEDPKEAEAREARLLEMREAIRQDILDTHAKLPLVQQFKGKKREELQEIEREVLDLITVIRVIINDRSKCLVCRSRVCTAICYPCKHQVLCGSCARTNPGKCPVPGCDIRVEQVFEPYTAASE